MWAVLLGGMLAQAGVPLFASEVIEDTGIQAVVRDHPQTGKPYVSIAAAASAKNPLAEARRGTGRPDYRMLDPKVKSGEIPYNGPYSDRKKVYYLAATLAAAGAAGAVAVQAAIPAAATATAGGAAGGAGAYAAAGAAVTAGTVSAAWLQNRPDPRQDDYSHEAESHEVRLEDGSKRTVNET